MIYPIFTIPNMKDSSFYRHISIWHNEIVYIPFPEQSTPALRPRVSTIYPLQIGLSRQDWYT